MTKDSKFWNKTAKKYSRQPIADIASYEHKLNKTREYLTKEMEVLEIGCGTGSTALLHAPYVKHYHGIDMSSEMINIASEKNIGIPNLTFCTTSVENFAISKKFDAVLALSVLHLVNNLDDTIIQLREILSDGGYLISSTVCLGEKMKFMKLLAPLGRFFGLMPLLRIFTFNQLRTSLRENGFSIEYEWSPVENKYGTRFIVARKV